MRIIVISVETAKDRRENCERQLEGVDFEFFNAVHWDTDLGRSIYESHHSNNFWTGFKVCPGAVCTAYSHMQVMKLAAEEQRMTLVLEDDFQFNEPYREWFLEEVQNDWVGQYGGGELITPHHIQYHRHHEHNLGRYHEVEYGHANYVRVKDETCLLSHSYAVHPDYADLVSKCWSRPIGIPSDHIHLEMSKCRMLTFLSCRYPCVSLAPFDSIVLQSEKK